MDQIITSIPTTPIGWVAIGVLLIVAVVFLISKIRRDDMDILRKSNIDLRASIDDKGKQINTLTGQVNLLISKVDTLEKKNKTLEDLTITALKQYFFENPEVAKTMKRAILGT